jgi:outer membrane protein assembly factor BamB
VAGGRIYTLGGPRSTPTVDGNRLFVMNTEGNVICLEAESGKEVWRRSLPDDFGSHMMQAMGTTDWRYAESPLVDGDKVIVTPGVTAAAMVALDKKSGEEIWRARIGRLGSQGAYGAAYSSVVISNGGGIKHYVQFIGRGLIGIEAETGRFLWGYNSVANDIANIATPLVHGNYVFASSGYGTGAALLELSSDGEGGVTAEEVYFLPPETFQNHHGGLILDGGFVFTGTGHNKGFPIAVRLEDGEVAWGPERNAGQSSAAITYADGRIYFRYQDGRMILVEATAEGYREHGTFMIPEVKAESWSHPVITDGRLYLREQDNLFAYDIRAK